MHFFTGAKNGFFYYDVQPGVRRMIGNGREVFSKKEIVWLRTADSGDSYWPHLDISGRGLVDLKYDEVV